MTATYLEDIAGIIIHARSEYYKHNTHHRKMMIPNILKQVDLFNKIRRNLEDELHEADISTLPAMNKFILICLRAEVAELKVIDVLSEIRTSIFFDGY